MSNNLAGRARKSHSTLYLFDKEEKAKIIKSQKEEENEILKREVARLKNREKYLKSKIAKLEERLSEIEEAYNE